MTRFLLMVVVGRLLIYLAQHFPPLSESRFEFVRRLVSCDLCLGVWVFTGCSWGFATYLFSDIIPHVPVLSELVTGSVTSFLAHLLVLGWKEKFTIVVVE